ncbi:MAG TPA: hypothetical protein VGG25_29345 [Streptosporangiaceae bacterium]|jgi:hypothetical protein
MNDRIKAPDSPEVTLAESASAAAADLAELAGSLPGDPFHTAEIADRISEEVAEVAAMIRSLPGRPREIAGHVHQAIAAFRTAIADGEDIGEFIATTLAVLAAEIGGSGAVIANRPGSWEAAHVAALLSGTVGPDGEYLDIPPVSSTEHERAAQLDDGQADQQSAGS